jgi:hypothetical protein
VQFSREMHRDFWNTLCVHSCFVDCGGYYSRRKLKVPDTHAFVPKSKSQYWPSMDFTWRLAEVNTNLHKMNSGEISHDLKGGRKCMWSMRFSLRYEMFTEPPTFLCFITLLHCAYQKILSSPGCLSLPSVSEDLTHFKCLPAVNHGVSALVSNQLRMRECFAFKALMSTGICSGLWNKFRHRICMSGRG